MNNDSPASEPTAGGDAGQLFPLVYDELRRLAAREASGEKSDQSLDATALVREAYLHLSDKRRFDNSGIFFAAAADAMRRILVDGVRRRNGTRCGCAGGGVLPDDTAAPDRSDELLALDKALTRLAALEPRKAKVVELRYFAGLPLEQVADVLGISAGTADRDWTYARAWLRREISKNS